MARPKIETALGDLLEIDGPVTPAGMGAFAMPGLAAAASNAGVPGAGGLSSGEHIEAVRRIRPLVNAPCGADLPLPQTASILAEGLGARA